MAVPRAPTIHLHIRSMIRSLRTPLWSRRRGGDFGAISCAVSIGARGFGSTRLMLGGGEARLVGGTEGRGELGVGELEGAEGAIRPLERKGEDDGTMRARLVYQSRKRGIREADLLLSTFADARLPSMTTSQMREYDRFLDENDWDIYYWATQSEASEPGTTTTTAAAGEAATRGAESARGEGGEGGEAEVVKPAKGEWAQTVGTYKPAYRPVPARWRESEVLEAVRAHVRSRRAGGGGVGGGMAFMPGLRG